jgi:hypothetical protein
MKQTKNLKATLGRVWTAAVAYVALVIGAGLSITFNVVDVTSTRGVQVDRWDILTAVAFPVLVVLMVELFVSRLWVGTRWPMQVIRWAGTVSIGGIAMRVSWTHGHDFFLSRGQAADVANLGPIAVDLLAIMATALILSGRTAGQRDSRTDAERVQDSLTAQEDKLAALSGRGLSTDAPTRLDTPRDMSQAGVDSLSTVPLDTGQDIDVPLTVDTAEGYLSRLSRDMDTDSVPAAPVSAPPVVQGHETRPFRQRGTEDALDVAVAAILLDRDLTPADKAHLAANHGVTTKTVGRRAAALKPAAEE